MFAGGRLTRALGSIQYGVELGEEAARKQLIHAGEEMVRAGLAIVVNHPGSKRPMCPLTAAERKRADQAARDDAAAAGNPNSHRRDHISASQCGFKHAITEVKDATRILTRLARRGRFNLGIEPRASRVVVVDLDTAGQVADFALRCGQTRPALTVRSPGKKGPDGEWVHSHGGHIYFDVPDDTVMPKEMGAYADPSGWKVMWGECQVLVPPSVRDEGPYVLVGSTHPLPEWLHTLITTESMATGERREESARRRAASNGQPCRKDEVSRELSWTTMLTEDGWVETGLVKNCGCPQWTAPGDHASPESATAHEPGCAVYVCDRGHGPLHVWTDTPSPAVAAAIARFGRHTLTKLEVLTFTRGGGDMHRTLNELEVPLEGPTVLGGRFSTWEEDEASNGSTPGPPPTPPPSDTDESEPSPDEDELSEEEERARARAEYEERQTLLEVARQRRQREATRRIEAEDAPPLRVLRGDGFLNAPRPTPLVSKMLYRDSLARIYGEAGSGKSFVALDIALSIALGKWWGGVRMTAAPVVYVMAEGQAVNADRTEAWLSKHGAELDENFIVVPDAVLLTEFAAKDLIELVRREQPVLVVLDTKNAMMIGEENSATDFAALRRTLDLIRKAAGCCVALVDHTGYEGTRARGSSAGTAAMDTEIRVTKDDSNKPSLVTAEVTRDKASEAGASWAWHLVPEHPAAVLMKTDVPDIHQAADPDKPQWRDASSDGLPPWIEQRRGAAKTYLIELARYMRFETAREQDPSGHGRTLAQAVADLKPPTTDKRVTDAWRTGVRRAWSQLKKEDCLAYWDRTNGGTDLQERSGAHVWTGPNGS